MKRRRMKTGACACDFYEDAARGVFRWFVGKGEDGRVGGSTRHRPRVDGEEVGLAAGAFVAPRLRMWLRAPRTVSRGEERVMGSS